MLQSIFLGVVEGVTEFLPVSSTGHLILAGQFVGFKGPVADTFEVFIQLGAIFAVVFLYRKKIFTFTKTMFGFWTKVLVAFLPSAVIGLIFYKSIKAYLFQPVVVATSLVVGGILIFVVEALPKKNTTAEVSRVGWKDALWVGGAQILAMIPGVSRSGATILGGVLTGFSRSVATEFSFFLALPTIFAASLYDLYKSRDVLVAGDAGIFAVGFLTAFVSAFIVIKLFLKYVSTHDFKAFGWYRIIFGLFLFVMMYFSIL